MGTKALLVNTPWGTPVLIDDPAFADSGHEIDNFNYLEEVLSREGSVFVDIGAHQGFYTSFLAQRAGPSGMVFAFEPHPNNLRYLLYNTIFRPSRAPVVVFPMALGSAPRSALMQCWWQERPMSSGMCGLAVGDEADYQVPVAVRTLDFFNLPRVDFIKIDVEHWEANVIHGGKNLILRDRPLMLVEIHSKKTEAEIKAFCQEHDLPCQERRAVGGVEGLPCSYLVINPPKTP